MLRLSATDGQYTTTLDVSVTVDDGTGIHANLAPQVSAGADTVGAVASAIALAGTVSDDG